MATLVATTLEKLTSLRNKIFQIIQKTAFLKSGFFVNKIHGKPLKIFKNH